MLRSTIRPKNKKGVLVDYRDPLALLQNTLQLRVWKVVKLPKVCIGLKYEALLARCAQFWASTRSVHAKPYRCWLTALMCGKNVPQFASVASFVMYRPYSALLVSIVLNLCEKPGTVQVRDQFNLHECAGKWFRP